MTTLVLILGLPAGFFVLLDCLWLHDIVMRGGHD